MRRRAFTLVELLIVVAIIGILIAVLLPALGRARKAGTSTACMSNLRSIGQALAAYSVNNDEQVIPSFNMTGTNGGADVPLDGWGPILDRDEYLESPGGSVASPFYCPDTVDVAGVASGQTGTDPNNPKGWLDWPFIRTGGQNVALTIPERRFNKIIRVSYWINADNPIGAVTSITPNLFYTSSVGYGPSSNGLYLRPTRTSSFIRPSTLVTVADGLYAGRQRDNRIGMTNSRIGYRHPGDNGSANVAFADGHVSSLGGNVFPRALGGGKDPTVIRDENLGAQPTVYANPDRVFDGM